MTQSRQVWMTENSREETHKTKGCQQVVKTVFSKL